MIILYYHESINTIIFMNSFSTIRCSPCRAPGWGGGGGGHSPHDWLYEPVLSPPPPPPKKKRRKGVFSDIGAAYGRRLFLTGRGCFFHFPSLSGVPLPDSKMLEAFRVPFSNTPPPPLVPFSPRLLVREVVNVRGYPYTPYYNFWEGKYVGLPPPPLLLIDHFQDFYVRYVL